MNRKEELNKEEDGFNVEMGKIYPSYSAAARACRADEITVFDPESRGWKNVKHPFSKTKRRGGRFW